MLGVGKAINVKFPYPQSQDEFAFEFLGSSHSMILPRKIFLKQLKYFNDAGIAVKMITGDYAETALAIAEQVQLVITTKVLTGKEA